MSSHDFLVFRLRGPLMAFGEITVGERRSLWDAPSKSAVLGLVAACLGLERDQHDELMALDDGLSFAVRIDHPGTPLRDYHTSQAAKEVERKRREKAGLPVGTRRDDLDCDDLSTMLSQRYYRVEAEVTVALWVRSDASQDLHALAKALKKPVFTPYLGRKSCPLSAPPCPIVLQAETLTAAFNAYDRSEPLRKILPRRKKPWDTAPDKLPIWFDAEGSEGLVTEPISLERSRRDGLRRRSLWQFKDRNEARISFDPIAFDSIYTGEAS